MIITVNGESREVNPDTTMLQLVEALNLNPKAVVAERNGEIIERATFDSILLNDGDVLELIRLVGGG